VLLYTLILCLVTLLPYITGMCGVIYLASALLLDARFLWLAVQLKRSTRPELPMRVFWYSIRYLALLFLALLVDHYLPLRIAMP
jgi:protoheme IX farnesyltransferase